VKVRFAESNTESLARHAATLVYSLGHGLLPKRKQIGFANVVAKVRWTETKKNTAEKPAPVLMQENLSGHLWECLR
jgi:hypothetical protein